MPLIEESLALGKSVQFYPNGVSMLPMLRQGVDRVVFSPLPEKLHKFDLPLYQRKIGQYVLHRIVRVEQTYTCIGDNHFDYERGLVHDQMIALVTAFYRGERRYEVTDWRYKAYCRIWHYSRPVRHLWHRGQGWLRRHLKCRNHP